MTAPTYTLRDRLPVIDVEAQAGREVTISVPVLGSGGGGVDVAGLVHVRAQVRLRWDSDLVLHAWDDVLGNATLDGTPGGTDAAAVVRAKLDDLYVTQKGCTRHLAVNRPRDYLCFNAATGKTDEVVFTFASLDPTATDPSRSQTNAFLIEG